MSNMRYNKRNILIALVIVFIIAVFVHLTVFQPFYDYELRTHEWFRSFQHQSDEWTHLDTIKRGGYKDLGRLLELEEIHEIVSKTKGYLVRDWSLWLGWNNVRYIVEASVLQAQLLNRTLVLPSYIYARGCEFPIESCAAYYNMVNRNDAFDVSDWRDLPIEEQMGWQIPISDMLDLPLLRSRHPTILVSEFLRIHGLDEGIERSKGNWDREGYHEGSYMNSSVWGDSVAEDGKPSLYVIHNNWYDENIARIDYLSEEMKMRGEWDPNFAVDPERERIGGFKNTQEDSEVYHKLLDAMGGGRKLDWGAVKDVLRGEKIAELNVDDDEVMKVLRDNGWEVLYTYLSHGGMDFMKTVTEPIYQVAPRSRIRGFKDDFENINEDVLLIEGETHLYRKPGQLEFSTRTGQDFFTTTVLHYIVPPARVYHLAEKLADRMEEFVGRGRMWMGAHMRRGDYTRLGWVMESSIEKHLERVKERLANGRNTLIELHNKHSALQLYDIPGAVPDTRVLTLMPPVEDAPLYVATDERDPISLAYLKSNNVILITDLLTPTLHRQFGYQLLITDILALVEQTLMSRADYFYGHVMSSVAGGIVNMRAREGKDWRCSFSD